MAKITLKEFWSTHNDKAIHCRTKEQAERLCQAFHDMGKTWVSGRSYLEETHWGSVGAGGIWYYNDRFYESFLCSGYTEYQFEDILNFDATTNKFCSFIKELSK